MMKKAIVIISIVAWGSSLFAQNAVDRILAEIESNNTSLSAYRKRVDAEIIGNKTGLTPQNPELEFNYLWGTPAAFGNRTDFSIRQSFDFPTAYAYKNQISDLKNEQAEWEYQKLRNEVLFQTRVILVRLTYHNALQIELNKQHANAKYHAGDMGSLDFNKAQIHLLNSAKERESNEIERSALRLSLNTLNGEKTIHFADSVFVTQDFPVDFDEWFAKAEVNNPVLQWVKTEMAIASKEEKLNSAMTLPKFFGGFMSETVVGQQFQGLSVGVTLPLWEDKNRMRYAKAQTMAMQSIELDTRWQYLNEMKALHAKIIALQSNVADYRSKLALYDNRALLEMAFNKGEIPLAVYLFELSLYYESIQKVLEMEMNLHLAFAEWMRF